MPSRAVPGSPPLHIYCRHLRSPSRQKLSLPALPPPSLLTSIHSIPPKFPPSIAQHELRNRSVSCSLYQPHPSLAPGGSLACSFPRYPSVVSRRHQQPRANRGGFRSAVPSAACLLPTTPLLPSFSFSIEQEMLTARARLARIDGHISAGERRAPDEPSGDFGLIGKPILSPPHGRPNLLRAPRRKSEQP